EPYSVILEDVSRIPRRLGLAELALRMTESTSRSSRRPVLDGAEDCGQNGAAHAATGHLADNAADIRGRRYWPAAESAYRGFVPRRRRRSHPRWYFRACQDRYSWPRRRRHCR